MSSYARISTDEAKRLATRTIEVIEVERNALDGRVTDRAKKDREYWRGWFPWLAPLSDGQAQKAAFSLHGRQSVVLYWDNYRRSQAVLNLVKAAGSDPFIYITAEDYNHIQFGEDHDRLQ